MAWVTWHAHNYSLPYLEMDWKLKNGFFLFCVIFVATQIDVSVILVEFAVCNLVTVTSSYLRDVHLGTIMYGYEVANKIMTSVEGIF